MFTRQLIVFQIRKPVGDELLLCDVINACRPQYRLICTKVEVFEDACRPSFAERLVSVFLSLSNRCIVICPLQCILWFRYILALSDQSKHSASSLSQLYYLHSSSDCCVGPVICMPGVRSVSPVRHSFSYIPVKAAKRDSRAV